MTQATFLKSLLNKGSEFEGKDGNNTIVNQTENVLNCFRIAPIDCGLRACAEQRSVGLRKDSSSSETVGKIFSSFAYM